MAPKAAVTQPGLNFFGAGDPGFSIEHVGILINKRMVTPSQSCRCIAEFVGPSRYGDQYMVALPARIRADNEQVVEFGPVVGARLHKYCVAFVNCGFHDHLRKLSKTLSIYL